MEIIKTQSWKDFINTIDKVREKYGSYTRELTNGEKFNKKNRLLFRGQADSTWELETTLERKTQESFHVLKYMAYVNRAVTEIESFTGKNWNMASYPEFEQEITKTQDCFHVHLLSYDFLVYLRHHGFPSPLLDWTESPYIAAYFAFISATKSNPAVYCYIERPNVVTGGTGGAPMISVKGPFVKTHKRHFAQKAWYTIATKWDYSEEQHFFCSHEEIFKKNNPKQDVLIKIELVNECRQEALCELNDYNINHFTLFQSEDSLIKAIETKQFELNEF